jgi:hypothetical protein
MIYKLNKCYSVTKSRRIRTESYSMYRANRNAYKILAGKPEGKKPLGRQRHR